MKRTIDEAHLIHALALAKTRRGFCAPNPAVGAVITLHDTLLATGYHFASGSPHAEVDALQKLSMYAPDSTVYVTLEPCCHWGKTPPCTDALIQAGVKRVVYGYADPNPIVNGKGESLLKAKNIACEYLPLPEIREFYKSYAHWSKTQTPFVTAKIALSLNGKIAGPSGQRMQLTGEPLQELTHASRRSADAILTTLKTILHDDPQLNVRLKEEVISKPVYILDSTLSLPQTAVLFKTAKALTIFHSHTANPMHKERLIELGARCVSIDENQYGLDLNQVIQWIGQDGMHDLWVEAGGTCFAAFVAQKLLQRAFIYVAPRWLGQGQTAFKDDFFLDLEKCEIHWKEFGKDVLCEIHW